MAVYALIKPINDIETIDNVIIADAETAATYLVANSGDYDYVIDLTNVDPAPGIGWTYDPGQNAFTTPPEDFEADLEAALMALDAALEGARGAYQSADSGQRSAAVGNVLSELSDSPEDELAILEEIIAYLDTTV